MQLGILPGLILVLAGNFLGGVHNTSGAAHQAISYYSPALYSVAAQATTTPTGEITPTAPVTSTVGAGGTITSTSVVTGSNTLTATATTTNTTPVATPIPLPTVGPQANLQINPFDWNFLTGAPALNDPNKVGPFGIAFLVVMVGLIAAGIYFLRFKRPQWKTTNPVLFKAVNRFAPYALWIGALGILLLLFRVVSLDFFNKRFWLYLDFLAALGLGGWIFYWYRTSYPKEMAKFQKTQKARQYMPSGGGGKVPARSTPVTTPSAKTSQPKPATTTSTAKSTPTSGSKPPQQSSKSRKRK
jgi:hypothetical protein